MLVAELTGVSLRRARRNSFAGQRLMLTMFTRGAVTGIRQLTEPVVDLLATNSTRIVAEVSTATQEIQSLD